MADMRQHNDLMIDFETMGQDESCCAVIACSFLFFEWPRFISNSPYTFEELLRLTKRLKLDVKQQVSEYNFTIEQDTLNFWQTTSPEVKAKISPKKDDLSVNQFANQMIEALANSPKVDYWWSRSNNFDPPIMWRLMRKAGRYHDFGQYVMFQRLRDVRTFIDAKFDFENKNAFVPITDQSYWIKIYQPHSSQHDIVADVMRLQAITRAECDLEQVSR